MSTILIRIASENDLTEIISMLADDELGRTREVKDGLLPSEYQIAFEKINQDINNEIVVMDLDEEIVGTLQVTYIPCLTYQGGLRAQIEAVRIKKAYRNKGYGRQLLNWAIERSRDKGCHMVQLQPTNSARKLYNSMNR